MEVRIQAIHFDATEKLQDFIKNYNDEVTADGRDEKRDGKKHGAGKNASCFIGETEPYKREKSLWIFEAGRKKSGGPDHR